MRYVYALGLVTSLICLTPRTAQAQGSIDGFGGLSLNRFNALDRSSVPFDFGGRMSVDVSRSVQLIGEVGRLGNVLPTSTGLLLSLTPVDFRVPAFYGEGGVRIFASRSRVSPYVEATVGMARLDFRIGGLNPIADAATRAALAFVDRTEPIAGGGAGLMIRGPVVVDLGYRYKQVLGNDLITTIVGTGQQLRVHQVRVGVGIRF